MAKSTKKHQIIFIYRDKLFFCNSNQNQSLEFPLTNEIIKDLEIIDQAKLENSLRDFLSTSEASTTETLIILNKNTYFRNTIEHPKENPLNSKIKIDEFSDLVPFNDIFVKQFTLDKKLETIAINREFYEPILSVLQKLDFQITMILPDLVVADLVGDASCTPAENDALIKIISKFKPYDLLGSGHKLLKKNDTEIIPIKEKNKRLVILVITFGILILMLIGVIIFSLNRTYDDPSVDTNIVGESQPIVTQTNPPIKEQVVQVQESSPSAILELDQYKIRVLNGSGIVGQAGIVKADLEDAGFSDIDIGNAQKISTNKTQVLLNPTLPATIRTLLLTVVEDLGQEYSIQENGELNYDIVITTTASQ